ncbi:MAG: dNTP triphosphohydrolase [Oscillospiraceae bacterium]|nr:dNTP triphosphohydrolase [Oscillospiraceae bacterium]
MLTWEKLLCAERERSLPNGAGNSRDIRSEFRKDYHRIIGSASFRRLQDKAQVYPLYRGDFVRTRLTHSLEVSSFAKSMGDTIFTRLINNKTPEIDEGVRENCCDILECAGLIHDIGNPPFGHFGEFSIRQWFKDNFPRLKYKDTPVEQLLSEQMKADLLNFEGNAQALRVLSRLHCLIDMQTGMNLTFALLNTIIKYPTSSVEIDSKCGDICKKKMGYYVSEQELFRKITEKTGAVGCRFPLTFILESADDIAYKTADIEDAVEKGLISYDIIINELSGERFSGMCENEAERRVLDEAVEELKKSRASAEKLRMESPEKAAVSRWIVKLQTRLIYAASDAFCENYAEIMNGGFRKELLEVSEVRVLCRALGDIAFRYAFRSEGIVRSELSESAVMTFLLDKIVGATLSFDTGCARMYDRDLSEVLSKNYIEICRRACEGKSDAEQCYFRLLLATDCVCGMTDGFAREFFLELQGVKISQNY